MSEENILAEIDWPRVEESPTIDFDTWIGIITTFKISYLDKILKEPTPKVPPGHLIAAKVADEIRKLLYEKINNSRFWVQVDDPRRHHFKTQRICQWAHDEDIEGLCRMRGVPLSEKARKFFQEKNFLYTSLARDSSGKIVKEKILSFRSLHISNAIELLMQENPGRDDVSKNLRDALYSGDPLLSKAHVEPPFGEKISRLLFTIQFCAWAEINKFLTVNEKLGEFPEDSKVGLEIKKWHKVNEGDQVQRESTQLDIEATLGTKEEKPKPDKEAVGRLAVNLKDESEGKMTYEAIYNHTKMQEILGNGQYWTKDYVKKHIIGPAIKENCEKDTSNEGNKEPKKPIKVTQVGEKLKLAKGRKR